MGKIFNKFRTMNLVISAILVGLIWILYQGYNKPKYEYFPSPSFDLRTEGSVIDTVVLHATQIDTLEKVIKYFSMVKPKLSSHYTIGKDGRTVQHVKDELRAWHAGESQMPDGRHLVNDFSIGIELVNLNDGLDPFPDMQVEALKKLIFDLRKEWPIKYIVTHAEIATPPGRKNDPLGFDLRRLGPELLDLRPSKLSSHQ